MTDTEYRVAEMLKKECIDIYGKYNLFRVNSLLKFTTKHGMYKYI